MRRLTAISLALLLPVSALATGMEGTWNSDVNQLVAGAGTSQQGTNAAWLLAENLAGNTGIGHQTGNWTPVMSSITASGTGTMGDWSYLTVGTQTEAIPIGGAYGITGALTPHALCTAISGMGFSGLNVCTVSSNSAGCSSTSCGSGNYVTIASASAFTLGYNKTVYTGGPGGGAGTLAWSSTSGSSTPCAGSLCSGVTQVWTTTAPTTFVVSTDLWTGTWVTGNFTAGTSNYPWIVLQSPAGYGAGSGGAIAGNPSGFVYMTLALNNATVGTWTIEFSTSCPTGGGASTYPETYSWNSGADWWGTQSLGSQAATAGFTTSNSNQHYVHVMLSTRGDFWYLEDYVGLGYFYSVFGSTLLQETSTADQFPVISMVCNGGNSVSPSVGFTPVSTGGYAMVSGTNNSIVSGRTYSGTLLYSGASSGSLAVSFPAIANSYSSSENVPLGAPVLQNSNSYTNAGAANASSSTYNLDIAPVWSISPYQERKGRLMDVKWASGVVQAGAVFGTTTPYAWIKIGPTEPQSTGTTYYSSLAFPWPASATPNW